ncbi:MAG: methyltransferase domain-containing protein [Methyloprofundus sp.]|nr:methyltransferase domain-containing protein [Methyloprofundus sp.]
MNTQFHLSTSEYYAPFPLFRLDNDWQLTDINLAALVLFELTLNDDFKKSIKQLIVGCQPQALETSDSPDCPSLTKNELKDAATSAINDSIDSEEFGKINFKLTMISLPKLDSENSLERTAYIEINTTEFKEIFQEHYKKTLQHQLIWESYAISYDLILNEQNYYREVLNRHITTLSKDGINQVIDIGAGTGNVTIPLLAAGCSVTAIDISRAMLHKMHYKLSSMDNPKIKISMQSAEKLTELTDRSFDGVNILLALFDMDDPVAGLNAAVRVLRLGGVIIITEPKKTFDLASLLNQAKKFLEEKGSYDKLSSHWTRVTRANKKIDPAKRSPLFIEDIEAQLVQAGFKIIQIKDSHFGNCATLSAIKTG